MLTLRNEFDESAAGIGENMTSANLPGQPRASVNSSVAGLLITTADVLFTIQHVPRLSFSYLESDDCRGRKISSPDTRRI